MTIAEDNDTYVVSLTVVTEDLATAHDVAKILGPVGLELFKDGQSVSLSFHPVDDEDEDGSGVLDA